MEMTDDGDRRRDGAPNDASKEVARQHQGGLTAVVERNAFGAEEARSWKKAFFICLACLVGMMFVGVPVVYNVGRYDPIVLGMTPSGQVMNLPPLNETFVSNTALLRFCAESITDVMTFGHHDYQRRLEGVRGRFTPEGFRLWTQNFAKHIEPSLSPWQQLYSSAISEPCRITEEGALKNGTKWWKLEGRGPLTVTSGGRVQNFVATYEIQIVRVSPLDNPDLLQIYNWQETDRK
jgi:hypothetical protein